MEETVLEINWWDVSTQTVIIIILIAVFGMVAIQIYKQWFSKK
jgi:hypothetical protein